MSTLSAGSQSIPSHMQIGNSRSLDVRGSPFPESLHAIFGHGFDQRTNVGQRPMTSKNLTKKQGLIFYTVRGYSKNGASAPSLPWCTWVSYLEERFTSLDIPRSPVREPSRVWNYSNDVGSILAGALNFCSFYWKNDF
jgi:hypothetical protein